MTVAMKELDGGRAVEIEAKDGVVYIEAGRICLHFDRQILLRALERELGVLVIDLEDQAVHSRVQARQ